MEFSDTSLGASSAFQEGHKSSMMETEKASRDAIVELLNEATMSMDGSAKIENLRKVQELLMHKDETLLDSFLDEVMGFQKDRSQEVRKFVVGFMEEACKKDPEILPEVVMNLQMMMADEAVTIQKRVIQAMIHIYRVALIWLSKSKTVTDNMQAVWTVICRLKDIVLTLLDSDNDGIRTHTIKFMEMLVISQTHLQEESLRNNRSYSSTSATTGGNLSMKNYFYYNHADFCLDQVPLTLKIARPRKLEEEANRVFEELLKYHGSSHISSANLMTCMGSLTNIAKLRPQFMPKVITALEMLQANLPPTLSKSQVSSVRKHLKNQLLALLKHKMVAENFFTNVTTLLSDLGATKDEITKAMPRFDEMKRRARKAEMKARAEKDVAMSSNVPPMASTAISASAVGPAAAAGGPAPGGEPPHGSSKRSKVDIPDVDSEDDEDDDYDDDEDDDDEDDDEEDEDYPDEDEEDLYGEGRRKKGAKRPKRVYAKVDGEGNPLQRRDKTKSKSKGKAKGTADESAVDITERFILARLTPAMAAEMVMQSMALLPYEIPPQFHNTYTPIAAAGTDGQVRHVSRLLATQLTAANIGPGVEEVSRRRSSETRPEVEEDDEDDDLDLKTGEGPSKAGRKMASAVEANRIAVIGTVSAAQKSVVDVKAKKESKVLDVLLVPAGSQAGVTSKKRFRTLKLGEITKPLRPEELTRQVSAALGRILGSERAALVGGVSAVRCKLITVLASTRPRLQEDQVKAMMLDWILQDLVDRTELAFSWLYEEYFFYQGFSRATSMTGRRAGDDFEYNDIFCRLVHGVVERTAEASKERESLLRRLYLESPLITEEAVVLLKQLVQMDSGVGSGSDVAGATVMTVVRLMRDLVMKRPTKKLNFLNFLLELCSHQAIRVRETAAQIVLQLHQGGDFSDIIEEYAVMYLRFLMAANPPALLFGEDRGRAALRGRAAQQCWTEDLVKVSLYLFFGLLRQSQKLLKNLAEVYAGSKTLVYDSNLSDNNDSILKPVSVQRTILQELDLAIDSVPISSPELLDLVQNCPPGSEVLVTRIVHILTDRAAPPTALVDRFRELYKSRLSSDVRLLIPVLTGLSKQEILAALPKLVLLSQGVVKEAFNRLLGKSGRSDEASKGPAAPLTPVELMMALHNIDFNASASSGDAQNQGTPMKVLVPAVKRAVDICFRDRSLFTQECLAIVLQQLLEQPALPLLLMRTIIQALRFHPAMAGFVINLLQKLILKQVWKNKLIWDGFVMCCKETVPQSFAVVLQLPAPQLRELLTRTGDSVRGPLVEYVEGLNDSQKAHISKSAMGVLFDLESSNSWGGTLTGSDVSSTLPGAVGLKNQDEEDLVPPGE